jgi:hypothetical protein
MIMTTIPHLLEQTPLSFSNALEQADLLARQALPQVLHERLSCAVALVKSGAVMQMNDGHTWEVESASVAGKVYSIDGQGCECEDARYRAPQGRCKHVLATLLSRKSMSLIRQAQATQPTPQVEPPVLDADGWPPEDLTAAGMPPEPPTTEPEPQEAVQGIDPKFIVWIQQRPFVRHAGLLKRAHECGLVSLTVEWTYNDVELSLAHAVAVFADGRRFEESGDATPANTNKKVAPHFRRVALTRASARALRLALGVDLVAVEELATEGD